jgi:hypothetical protein
VHWLVKELKLMAKMHGEHNIKFKSMSNSTAHTSQCQKLRHIVVSVRTYGTYKSMSEPTAHLSQRQYRHAQLVGQS